MASKRVAVVTGSNKGIGLAIVRSLCKKFDGDVILTSRDEGRGKEAVKQLKEKESLNPVYHQLDITNAQSIEGLVTFVKDTYGGLDVLINNAGIAYKSASTAPDLEQATVTMATNFTATLNISRAFFPLLRPGARVVNVASFTGKLSKYGPAVKAKFTDPNLTEAGLVSLMEEYISVIREGKASELGWNNTKYGTSKTAVIALSKIHAKELAASDKKDILVNSCCPGWVKTDMAGDRAPLTPDEGAVTPVTCALLPPGSPNGEFWRDQKVSEW
ncbi:PREDICTED: carbonyl reductase [NADPH] 1-like isoform X1 [Amphimedon queenslandica]|uniref:carbonyl reductase (NADPH) n=1 Tax=Amphimedon queenslandica TaxID=400682 RepID=A0A1X7V6M6_AMPQE|nr:PREDICTED: carbonyl reductase [NADPH] 1-like isoform X1 [Amphimedon queenslandica]|eukprot:XP_019850605.1 PREDICTED: carbonyl reductase [NADPH] 1-like isoform X1 [Amphimedon queenslandica]